MKITTKVAKRIELFKKSAVGLALTYAMSNIYLATAHAGNTLTAKDNSKNLVQKSLEAIIDIFPWIGAFFVVAGGFKLVMAYRNDQPEAQTSAAKDIVIGAVFLAFKFLFWDAFMKSMIFG